MNMLIEIGHPAHVHFFRNIIDRIHSEGSRVVIVTRNKEITNSLLNDMGLDYISISKPATGKIRMFAELLKRWFVIWRILGKEKIDVAVSISGISTAVPARLRNIPNLTITDTEDATISNFIAFPFSDFILTPEFYLKNLGPKHLRYRGLHELAYLRDYNHDGLDNRLIEIGIERPYSIIRLIAYDALHDRGINSYSDNDILDVIEWLEQYGKVYITSQRQLTGVLERYSLNVPITRIHDVLAGAIFYIGESPTMAVEAGVMGTPSFLISDRARKLGYVIKMQEIGLVNIMSDLKSVKDYISKVEKIDEFKDGQKIKASKFAKTTIDVSEYIYESVNRVLRNERPISE